MKTAPICPALNIFSFVFVGKKAVTGIPHPTTGKMSVVGNYYAFLTRKEANEFAEIQEEINDQQIIEIGSPDSLLKYSEGISLKSYIEHLKYILQPYVPFEILELDS